MVIVPQVRSESVAISNDNIVYLIGAKILIVDKERTLGKCKQAKLKTEG